VIKLADIEFLLSIAAASIAALLALREIRAAKQKEGCVEK